jgi:polar amino acid transport system substrate-binding protein
MKRAWAGLLASVIAILLIPAMAHARSLDDILKAGVIRVGVNPNLPPMSSLGKNNEFEGFDIDIGNKIAEALKVKVEFVPQLANQRLPFLTADRTDISLGALTRTAERAKLIDYTAPLHTEAMAVLTTEKVTVSNWKELNDEKFTLVDQRGNWTVGFAQTNLPKAKMFIVDSTPDVVRAVAQGRADAIVNNIDFFMALTKNYPDVKWKILKETITVAYNSIGLQRGNDALRQFLNILLYDLHSSGFVNQTWEKWYGAPMLRKVEPQPFF